MNNIIEKKDYCIAWWLVVTAMLCMFGTGLLIPDKLFNNHHYGVEFLKRGSMIIPCILGIIHLAKRKSLHVLKSSKLRKCLIPVICILPIAALHFIIFFIGPINTGMDFLFGLGNAVKPDRLSEIFFAAITMCFVTPVLEEFFFRGIMMNYIKKYGIILSLFIPALAAVFIDFSPNRFFTILLIGILLGTIRLLTNSLMASILAHISMNIFEFTLLIIPFVHPYVTQGLIISSIILFPFSLCMLLKLSSHANREGIIYGSVQKTGLSVGMLICTVIYILYIMIIILAKLDIYLSNMIYVI